MTTLYALLLQACGLSQREAAAFSDVRPDTVRSWSIGRRQAPDHVLRDLAALSARIEHAADQMLEQIAEAVDLIGGAPRAIDLGYAVDDHEAQSLGWPCVGAQHASLALVAARGIALGYRFEAVPRGTASATAAAADAHETSRSELTLSFLHE